MVGEFLFTYSGDSRELRKIIVAILKSGVVAEVKKINYGHKFVLNEKSVKKSEIKLLFIQSGDEEKLMSFLSKNFPQIERIRIS